MPRVLNMRLMNDEAVVHGGVRVDRATKWGNPFVLGRDGTRDEVCEFYELWFESQPHLVAALPELTGFDLLCWCAPLRCHADYLLRRANP